MHSSAARREDGRMEPFAEIPEDTVTAFSVGLPGILDDHRGTPVQVGDAIERQVAAFDVGSVLGWVVGDLHWYYCIHNKELAQIFCEFNVAGLLRSLDEAPPIRDNPEVVSLNATLGTGILLGRGGDNYDKWDQAQIIQAILLVDAVE